MTKEREFKKQVRALAKEKGIPYTAARREVRRTQPATPSITCPVCGMTSYNPNDIEQGYCGNCHDFTGGAR